MKQTHSSRGTISFEFFPPHSTEATLRLWRSVERLAPLAPRFMSVTYGAGGTTRTRTRSAIRTIQDRARIPVAGHLTCVGASRDETLAIAREYGRMGVRKIVALRGDPPKGQGPFTPHPEGFANAAELVAALSREGWKDIVVAAYPEVHPEAASADSDLDNLKAKFDAGATSAITQFFFDVEDFLRLRDRAAAAGIKGPILPGILPIESFEKMARFAAGCGAKIPANLRLGFEHAVDEEQARLLAISVAVSLCDRLREEGAEHLHFYTLNNPDLTYDICRALGVQSVPFAEAAGAGAA